MHALQIWIKVIGVIGKGSTSSSIERSGKNVSEEIVSKLALNGDQYFGIQ